MKISKKKLRELILQEVVAWGSSGVQAINIGGDSSSSGKGGKGSSGSSVANRGSGEVKTSGKIKVIFFGDSQLAWNGSFPNYLSDNFEVTRNSRTCKNGANLSKIKSFVSSELTKDNYDVVCIWGGGNSSTSGYDLAKEKTHYDEMYQYVKSQKPTPVLVALTNPTKTAIPGWEKKYPHNEDLAQHVREHKEPDVIIDANAMFRKKSDFHDNPPVHLKSGSHKSLASEFEKRITPSKGEVSESMIKIQIKDYLSKTILS